MSGSKTCAKTTSGMSKSTKSPGDLVFTKSPGDVVFDAEWTQLSATWTLLQCLSHHARRCAPAARLETSPAAPNEDGVTGSRPKRALSLVFQYSLQTVQFQEGSVPPVERGASSSCLPPPSLLETFARASLVRCPGSHNLTCPSPTLAEFSRARLRSTACTLRLESRHQIFPQFI